MLKRKEQQRVWNGRQLVWRMTHKLAAFEPAVQPTEKDMSGGAVAPTAKKAPKTEKAASDADVIKALMSKLSIS